MKIFGIPLSLHRRRSIKSCGTSHNPHSLFSLPHISTERKGKSNIPKASRFLSVRHFPVPFVSSHISLSLSFIYYALLFNSITTRQQALPSQLPIISISITPAQHHTSLLSSPSFQFHLNLNLDLRTPPCQIQINLIFSQPAQHPPLPHLHLFFPNGFHFLPVKSNVPCSCLLSSASHFTFSCSFR